jgi:hypothetical protein
VTGFGALVVTFLRDFARRRLFWALIILTVAILGINYWTSRLIDDAVGTGETWDIATRQAASRLEGLSSWLRGWIAFVVILLSAQVAPESRRNGTTQFVLSLGVRREVLAGAQLVALFLLLGAAMAILHAGFAAAGLRTGYLSTHDAALAWISLVVPMLALAACVFALSLTASAIETYLVFFGVPLLVRTLPAQGNSFPSVFPRALVRALENLGLLFPDPDSLMTWPLASFGAFTRAPYPLLAWPVAHFVFAVAFWIALGHVLQHHHDFGSRTALK